MLAGIAFVAYSRHLKGARMVDGRAFLATIQARQETYFQRFGWYANASATTGNYYPALGNSHCVGGGSSEPCPKAWNDTTYKVPTGWIDLGARPERNTTYFAWLVLASTPPQHSFLVNPQPALLGIPAQPTTGVSPHPWYYAIGRADLDGSGIPCVKPECTVIYTTSARANIVTLNEGK